VLYVLSKNFGVAEAPGVARTFLTLGHRLLEAGGIAVKCKSSGISHSRARWLQCDQTANGTVHERFTALFNAYVQYPIGSATELYTCGMHLLGGPDLIISEPTLQICADAGEPTAFAVARLFRVFALYFFAECPVGGFVSGHTFSVDRGSPRFQRANSWIA
jgi:hypothetical protein